MTEHDPGLHEGRYTYVGPHPRGFVALTHPDPDIGGGAKVVWVHPSNVGYYTARGWEEATDDVSDETSEDEPASTPASARARKSGRASRPSKE